ncbi:hypothetical protein GGF32_006906 [Allomyces javanicus]|nr:hypothetical protein GGF32_006906 [Allomyces javanicus]
MLPRANNRTLHHFAISNGFGGSTGGLTVPPQCRSLTLSGIVPWRNLEIPSLVVSLRLVEVVAPSSVEFAEGVFRRLLPPNLQRLRILRYDPEDDLGDGILREPGATLAQLLEHVPDTLKLFELEDMNRDDPFPDKVTTALAGALSCVRSLTSFSLVCYGGIRGLDTVLARLPRTGLRYLKLYLLAGGNEGNMCSLLASSMPTSVMSLEFDFASARDDHAVDTLAVATRIPVATHRLTLSLRGWDETVAGRITLSSTLQHLSLIYGFLNDAASLAPLLERLPASLKSLNLCGLKFGASRSVAALARGMPPHLEVLRIENCGLTTADAALLAASWPPSLREVKLSGNGIQVDAGSPLAFQLMKVTGSRWCVM